MSIVSFNREFSGSVKLAGSSFDNRQFYFRHNTYSDYNASFEVEYKTEGTSLTLKEETCYSFPDTEKDYVRPLFTSSATESGYSNLGFPKFVEKSFLGRTLPFNYGKWIPNTNPEIRCERDSSGIGRVEVDGDYTTTTRVYTVQHPDGLGNDVPIYLPANVVTYAIPAIVYDGDIIYIYPNDFVLTPGDPENFLVKIIRQKRYPKPDRTFFWTPNTSPVLTKGGYANGELMKPGTVMIPTQTTSLRAYDGGVPPPPDIPQDEILPIDYVYAGQGVMFDGNDWVSLSGSPERFLKKDGTYAHRNVGLYEKYLDEDQPHISLVERFFSTRPVIVLSAPVDSSPSGQAFLTAYKPDPPLPGPEPTDLSLQLNCVSRAFFQLLVDFGDAWSRYHSANKDWRDALIAEYGDLYTFGWTAFSPPAIDPDTGDPLEEFIVSAPSQTFRNGEITEVEVKDQDGNVVAGSSLSITINAEYNG